MAFKNDYLNEVNRILLHNGLSINMLPARLRKNKSFVNDAIREVRDTNSQGVWKPPMKHIVMSMRQYFDIGYLVKNILDDDNRKILTRELAEENNIKT